MQISKYAAPLVVALTLSLGACSKGADTVSQPVPVQPAPAQPVPGSSSGGVPSSTDSASSPPSEAPQNVVPSPADAGPQGFSVTGTVVEKIDLVESKTMYVQLNTGSESVWVATKQIDVATGDRVKASDAMEMRNFASPSLGRTFDVLYMASEIEKLP